MNSIQHVLRPHPVPPAAPPLPPAPALQVLRALFERLHEAGVRYCHWKSNEHLGPSMVGKTDVDVLVDRRAIVDLARILGESGFKRFVVEPGRGYPGIEDYVGFDSGSGVLTHLHVHYQLTLGEKFLKGHRLPWEEMFLSTRILDARHGIYVADPHLELLVLVIRAAMKVRTRDSLLEAFGRPYLRGGMLRELRWLAERTDRQRLQQVAARLVGEGAARQLPALTTGARPSVRLLRAFGRSASPALSTYRLYGPIRALQQMATRELRTAWRKVGSWYRGMPIRSTRTLPQGGLFVAVLGVDGAGKSTLTEEIAEWLAHEVAVMTTYGGSGKGSASLPRRMMQTVAGWRRRLLKGASRTPRKGSDTVEPARPPSLARLFWLLSLVRERRRRARSARRAKGTGMIVISDRIPQSQFPGWNDGPRLRPWLNDRSALRRFAARREDAVFQVADLVPPDLVLKLRVSPQVASQRKPETPTWQLRTGAKMVAGLQFPTSTRVVELDAEAPLHEVVLLAKRAIWECL